MVFVNMEFRVFVFFRFIGLILVVVGLWRISYIFIVLIKGMFIRNGIYVVEELIKRVLKWLKVKDYEIIYKVYLEIREENGVLRYEG